MSIDTDIEYNLAFTDKMYIPESILIGWFSLSAIVTASSLIFYNMARKGSLKIHPYIAKFISIGLILVSTFYMLYSLAPYYSRMSNLATTCKRLQKCDDEQIEHITRIKNIYLLSGITTSIIQLIITYVIVVTV
jgi:hypothetical protein